MPKKIDEITPSGVVAPVIDTKIIPIPKKGRLDIIKTRIENRLNNQSKINVSAPLVKGPRKFQKLSPADRNIVQVVSIELKKLMNNGLSEVDAKAQLKQTLNEILN